MRGAPRCGYRSAGPAPREHGRHLACRKWAESSRSSALHLHREGRRRHGVRAGGGCPTALRSAVSSKGGGRPGRTWAGPDGRVGAKAGTAPARTRRAICTRGDGCGGGKSACRHRPQRTPWPWRRRERRGVKRHRAPRRSQGHALAASPPDSIRVGASTRWAPVVYTTKRMTGQGAGHPGKGPRTQRRSAGDGR